MSADTLELQRQILEELRKLNKRTTQNSEWHQEAAGATRRQMSLAIAFTVYCCIKLYLMLLNAGVTWLLPAAMQPAPTAAAPIFSETVKLGQNIAGFEVSQEFKPGQHDGVDLGMPVGTPLHAIGISSTVTVKCEEQRGADGDYEGWGIYALITDTGMDKAFLAGHLDKCDSGTYKPGQAFGTTGNTGRSTGPHLHFEQFSGNEAGIAGDLEEPTVGYVQWMISGNPPADPGQALAESGLDDFTRRIGLKESGHDYGSINTDSGALGKYQFMPSTIDLYAPECLGSRPSNDEFLASPELQDKLMDCYTQDGWKQAQEIANGDPVIECRAMAAFHYAGDVNLFDSSAPQGNYPSIAEYTADVCK